MKKRKRRRRGRTKWQELPRPISPLLSLRPFRYRCLGCTICVASDCSFSSCPSLCLDPPVQRRPLRVPSVEKGARGLRWWTKRVE